MKKYLVLGVISALAGSVNAETKEPKQNLNEITEIVIVEGQNKEQLFEASKVWIAKSFKSANNVIQYADKNTGSIIGKGNFPYPCDGFIDCNAFGKDVINFTIKIDTKDDKVRIIFSDIKRLSLTPLRGAISPSLGKEFAITQEKQQKKVKEKFDFVIQEYKTNISNQKADSDW